MLENDLQSHGLLLLTEDAQGVRRLRWAERDGGGYTVRSSNPLPANAYLDLFHFDDDEIGLQWSGQDGSCSFSPFVGRKLDAERDQQLRHGPLDVRHAVLRHSA